MMGAISARRQGSTIGDLRNILAHDWSPPSNPFDEVYPGIYIGDATTALSLRTLQNEGISHVLNGASPCASCLSKQNCGGCVLTKRSFYPDPISFAGIQANDERRFPIFRSFQETSGFIEEGINNGALDADLLRKFGVTHVLNAAQGVNTIRYVNTCQEYYALRKFNCEFLGIPAMDLTAYQLHPFFLTTTDFIDEALSNSEGKILVHCREGISRSATLVLAYLMIKKEMTVVEAVKLVRSKRTIFPNDGFLEQLCDLDLRLRGQRSYRGK